MNDATVLARATREATGGLFELVEYTLPPYCAGLPPHCDIEVSVACYVLDGLLALTLDTRTLTAARGTCILISPGTTYAFFNPTATATAFLLWRTPRSTRA